MDEVKVQNEDLLNELDMDEFEDELEEGARQLYGEDYEKEGVRRGKE